MDYLAPQYLKDVGPMMADCYFLHLERTLLLLMFLTQVTYKNINLNVYIENNITLFKLDSGKLSEFECEDGSQIVLDVFDDNVLINRRNFFQQDVLLKGVLPASGQENTMSLEQVSVTNVPDSLKDKKFEYMDLSHANNDEVGQFLLSCLYQEVNNKFLIIDNFTAIYIGPKSAEDASIPLVIFPHGGPHSASVNA